jgi:hypothetical protein
MKNHWLNRKKRWKRFEIFANTCWILIEGSTKITCEKSNDTLEKIEAEFEFTDLIENVTKQYIK